MRCAGAAYGKYPTITAFCADMGYRGTFAAFVKEKLGLCVDISEKIKPHEWEKLPWRWVVERTFAWFNHHRLLAKDYEITIAAQTAAVLITSIYTMIKRL
jgi:putative transposase